MKPVLAWIKANVLIVVFGALILVILPTAWFFSSSWGESQRNERAKAANDQLTKLKSATVDYKLPQVDPNVPEVALNKTEPNSELTTWFKENKENLAKVAAAAYKLAEDFNKGLGAEAAKLGRSEHVPKVSGLFPKAENKDAEIEKLNQMEDKLLGKRGNPNPYQALLDKVRAGGPADPVKLAAAVHDLGVRETEKVTANKRELTPEERVKIDQALAERRLGEYQNRSREISFYATMQSLPQGPNGVQVDKIADPRLIEPNNFYVYQWDLWVMDDVLTALRVANTSPDGRLMMADQGVVKRLESMQISGVPGMGVAVAGQAPLVTDPNPPTPAPDAKPGLIPTDPRVSITGRTGGAWNAFFDVRQVKVTVVVSSSRLRELVHAIERTNFMSVIDVDLSEVDAWEDLRQGYFYGQEHVLRAKLTIETVWLRSWTEPLMPDRIKAILTGKEATEGGDAAGGGSAPPPPPPSEGGGRGRIRGRG
ncbi:MAG: hypothetical protein WC718_08125 [Phycisphaerales bacterium]|jgi:hypothetical protein